MRERIYVSGPSITQREISYVTDAVTNAWYSNANMYHERFEKAFADYVGVKYAIALPSCTSGIHLAYMALGIGEGDEVIVPETTWIATAAPLKYVGAHPRFVDIDPDSWCMSVESVKKAISPKTKAIMTVDLYGNMPDMDALQKVADEYGIPLIEDSAEAIGAEYHGRKAGSLGCIGLFSFHGSKTMTTGEGGMFLTDDKKLYERALFLRDHGRYPGDFSFRQQEVAYKYKMSSMQAALGLAQIERIDELVNKKRQIFSWYQEQLKDEPVQLNSEAEGIKNTYWMVSIIMDEKLGKTGLELSKYLKQSNIDTRPFFYPLSSIPAYEGTEYAKGMEKLNPVSYKIAPLGINLPCGLDMTQEKVKFVCDEVKVFITGGTGFIGKEIIETLNDKQNNASSGGGGDRYKFYALTRQLLDDLSNICYIQGDISDVELLERTFKEIKPEYLLHLAWDVKDLNYAHSPQNEDWVIWSKNLLKLFLKYGGKHVIVSGTCFEYDLFTNKPHKESEEENPSTPYGKAKLKVCRIFKELCTKYNARLVWGRIFYPYGRGESERKLVSAAKNAFNKNQNFLCKSPESINDYINVRDVAKIFKCFLINENANGIYNVGTGEGYKIRDIILNIAEILGKKHLLKFGDSSAQYVVADTRKLRSVYTEDFLPLKEGLQYVKEGMY